MTYWAAAANSAIMPGTQLSGKWIANSVMSRAGSW